MGGKRLRLCQLATPFEAGGADAWERAYPRPQLRRASYQSLCGLWRLAVLRGTRREELGEIRVPFPPESRLSGIGRRLEPGAVRRACAATALYLFLVLVGVLVILAVDAFPLHDVLFECLSAMGTVGLTRGITGSLEPVSRLVLISLMYAGRVGSLSIVMAFVERKQGSALRKPIEKIIIG